MNDKDLKDFCQRYGATVRPSQHRYVNTVPIKYSDYHNNTNIEVTYQHEQGVEITMSQSSFAKLINFAETLEQLCRDYKDYGFTNSIPQKAGVSWIETKMEEDWYEKKLRRENPILNDLWQQYEMMKELINRGNRP